MNDLTNILEAVAVRVADISWRASALAALVLLITALASRRIAPRWRFALWSIVLLRFAAPFTPAAPWSLFALVPPKAAGVAELQTENMLDAPVNLANPINALPSLDAVPTVVSNPMYDATSARPAGRESTPIAQSATVDWIRTATVLWFTGTVALAMRAMLHALRLRRRKQRWTPVADSQLCELFKRCRAEAGIGRDVPLFLAADDAGPASIGLWRSSVVLPASLVDSMPPVKLRLILLHELVHCRRRDVLVDRLAALIAAIHWFNPIAWFALSRLRSEREMACDAAVLDLVGGQERRHYGGVVLNVMQRCARQAALPGFVGFSKSASATRRISGIAGYRKASPKSTAIGAAIVAAVVLGGFTKAMQVQAEPGEATTAESTGKDTTTASDAAPASAKSLTLSGRCMDGETPLAGVRLRVLRVNPLKPLQQAIEEEFEQQSSDDGQFSFSDLLPPPSPYEAGYWRYVIIATASGRASAMRPFIPGDTISNAFQFDMPPAASLRGRVTDHKGQPVAGAEVWALSPLNRALEGFMSASTDAEGRYEIADMAPWDEKSVVPPPPANAAPSSNGTVDVVARYSQDRKVTVRHPEFSGKRGNYKRVPAEVDVSLQPAATIEGIVFDDVSGLLAADVVVSMQVTHDQMNRDLVDSFQRTTTDADGRYRLTSLSPGKYNIWVDAKDRTCAAVDSIETVAGQKKMAPIIRLAEGGWIEGQVLDAAMKPMPLGMGGEPVQIGLYGPSRPKSGAAIQSTTVDAEGKFRMRASPGTNYPYICSPVQDPVVGPPAVEVVAGETVKAFFRVVPDRPLRAQGRPVDLPPVELPLPIEAERAAAAEIRRFGGWYELDDEDHVTKVNMVYHGDGKDRRDNAQLVDTALQHVSAFPRLKTLLLKEGQATNDGLKHLRGMAQLERIYIWDASAVTDEGAAHLAAVPNLQYIHLSNAALTDKAIELWKALPHLTGLSLQGNRFSDLGLKHASEIKDLRELIVGLSENGQSSITDEGLAHVAKLTSLETLDLQQTGVTDAGLKHLAGLGRLRKLWLGNTLVTTEGIAELKKQLPDFDDARAGVGKGSLLKRGADIVAAVQAETPPRLAYLAWQVLDGQGEGPAVGPIWDAKGNDVDAETSAELRKLIDKPVFHLPAEDALRNARPLVLWFEDDSILDTRAVMPTILMADGKSAGESTAISRRMGEYRVSAAAPVNPFIWGPTVSLRISFPTESPKLVTELREVPGKPVEIDADAEWQGVAEADGRLASTLRVRRKPAEEGQASFGARLYAKGHQWPADNDGGIVRIVDDREERVDWYKIKTEDVDLVRLTRQEYGTAVIEDVPLRHDLYPELEQAEAAR